MDKVIHIAGLGGGDVDQMPLGIYKRLKSYEKLFLRTVEHPAVKMLEEENIAFKAFDDIYEKHENFEDVYVNIVSVLLEESTRNEIVYAVPGHPLVAERTVQLLIKEEQKGNCKVNILGGQSFLDPLFTSVKMDPIEGFQLLDATDFNEQSIVPTGHIIIGQVYDQFVASEVKLTLMQVYPDEYEVYIVTAAGSKDEKITKVKLYELDHNFTLNQLTSIYIPPIRDEQLLYKQFSKLREVIRILRSPNGCPWDKKQTHESLKKYLIEEAYEVIDAIDEGDVDHLIEELGDLLLQIMLHSQIGEDDGYFTIDDVIESITAKMIRRHPHVFGSGEAKTADDVVQNWEEIKRKEKTNQEEKSILDNVPRSLPGLLRAYKLQKKAAGVGFDWDDVKPMWDKVKEELAEFEKEVYQQSHEKMEAEFGDLLFAFVNIARHYDIDPENAIFLTNTKFTRRFQYIERAVKEKGLNIEAMQLDELDVFWEEAKKEEKDSL